MLLVWSQSRERTVPPGVFEDAQTFELQQLNPIHIDCLFIMFVPGELQFRQLDVHLLHHRRQREAFRRQQRKAVPHRDQTQIHHHCIVGGGRLGDDDQRRLQFDVHGQAESLLGKVPDAGRRLLRRLSSRSAQSFFGRLEVVEEHLKADREREDKYGVT